MYGTCEGVCVGHVRVWDIHMRICGTDVGVWGTCEGVRVCGTCEDVWGVGHVRVCEGVRDMRETCEDM